MAVRIFSKEDVHYRNRAKQHSRDHPTVISAHGVLRMSKGLIVNKQQSRNLYILLGIGIAMLSIGLVFLVAYLG